MRMSGVRNIGSIEVSVGLTRRTVGLDIRICILIYTYRSGSNSTKYLVLNTTMELPHTILNNVRVSPEK